MQVKLGIVIPCYNEEEVLPITADRLKNFFEQLLDSKKISQDSVILFVDDGSDDKTWDIIPTLHKEKCYFDGMKLARNVGHQNALLSGMMSVKEEVDAVITIDADLQDDIEAMEQMLAQYEQGCDIVYGVRNSRETDSLFKRGTAVLFYKLMHFMGTKTIYNHADYRLMSKRAIFQLEKYEERNLFLRGVIPLLGYKVGYVYYARKKREAGISKYPLKKMLSFAVDGITSFSVKPLILISMLGFACVMVCVMAIVYILYNAIVLHVDLVSGWASLIVSIWFLGGVQLLSLGIVGIYVGKTYMEVKKRPRYNIEKRIGEGKNAGENE